VKETARSKKRFYQIIVKNCCHTNYIEELPIAGTGTGTGCAPLSFKIE
jgi:hypothetical protein